MISRVIVSHIQSLIRDKITSESCVCGAQKLAHCNLGENTKMYCKDESMCTSPVIKLDRIKQICMTESL